ncbi:DUF4190 domain-containing protein [Microbacterium sp. NPDC007973]|uniref:DUF4190 domain-containing protein n=1 Tax=Microbacterium sp. NPDC007973 TaxID=3364182 RepID=UPI0036EE186C
MSDDRTPAPNQPEQATGAGTPVPDPSGSPYAPRDDASDHDATARTDADESRDDVNTPAHDTASAYGESAPAASYDAPDAAAAYGASPSGTPAYPAAASGEPATPPYDTTGTASSTYGAPAYGAPAYGAPAYGGSAYGTASYGYGTAPTRTNPLAIVSLVASLVGIFVIPVIGQIVGIVTGHISLKQIKTSGERGRGMGLAGLLIGYISLGLGALIVIGFVILVAVTAGSSGSRYGV